MDMVKGKGGDMRIGIIGKGAISQFVARELSATGHMISAYLLRENPSREQNRSDLGDAVCATSVAGLPTDLDVVIDCAGHAALREHGCSVLEAGIDLVTVSCGALADQGLSDRLQAAAENNGTNVYLASGAIGALDALRAARAGGVHSVCYTGRKPPLAWKGSRAEEVLDLTAIEETATTHFRGTAREAALAYPQNANVAAAVALAGIGWDQTTAELIADPTINSNIHKVQADGEFGQFEFSIAGNPLPNKPGSSALAAMSVVAAIDQRASALKF